MLDEINHGAVQCLQVSHRVLHVTRKDKKKPHSKKKKQKKTGALQKVWRVDIGKLDVRKR